MAIQCSFQSYSTQNYHKQIPSSKQNNTPTCEQEKLCVQTLWSLSRLIIRPNLRSFYRLHFTDFQPFQNNICFFIYKIHKQMKHIFIIDVLYSKQVALESSTGCTMYRKEKLKENSLNQD